MLLGLWPAQVSWQRSGLLGTSVSHMPGDGVDAQGWGAASPLVCGSQVLGSPACLGQTSSGDSSQAPVGMAVKQLRASLQPLLQTGRLSSAPSNGKNVWMSMTETKDFPLGLR